MRPGPVRRFRPFPVRRHRLSPAVSRGCSGCFYSPGIVSRTCFSGPPSDSPSIAFKSVKIWFSLSLRSGAAQAAFVRPARLRAEFRLSSDDRLSAVRFSGLPPGPGLLFRSFAVRFVHGPYLVSFCVQFCSFFVRFGSVRLILRPVPSASVRFSVSFVCSVLSSFHVLCPLTGELLLFSRILYTSRCDFQMYFLSENMSFLRIVQIIDINPKKFTVSGYSFLPSQKRQNSKIASFFRTAGLAVETTAKRHPILPAAIKKTYSIAAQKRGTNTAQKLTLYFKAKETKSFISFCLFSFILFAFLNTCFQKKTALLSQAIFSRHPRYISLLPSSTDNRRQTRQNKIGLIGHIRLIEKFLSPCFHSFLSSVYFPFPSPCPVAARIRAHTNTTQNRTNDTFYFLREVIYYSFE